MVEQDEQSLHQLTLNPKPVDTRAAAVFARIDVINRGEILRGPWSWRIPVDWPISSIDPSPVPSEHP